MTIIANKTKVLEGLQRFIENEMIPHADGNYRIILRGAKAAIALKFDRIYESLKSNPLVAMTGVIDGDSIDLDEAAQILNEAFGADEFCYSFKLLGEEYAFHISAKDIGNLKSYIERA